MNSTRQEMLEYLGALYGIAPASSGETRPSDLVDRRERALHELRSRAGDTPARSRLVASKRAAWRPKKLTWLDERKIAIFIAQRVLAGRLVKNAMADVTDKFPISRSTAYRIWQKHRTAAEFFALAMMKHSRKKFRTIVSVRRRIQFPNFSNWGPDRY